VGAAASPCSCRLPTPTRAQSSTGPATLWIRPRCAGRSRPRSSRRRRPLAHQFIADSAVPDTSRAGEGAGTPGQRKHACAACWPARAVVPVAEIMSGIHPGYSCKEGRIVEDGLLVEFPCTTTRTRTVYSY
jgi:hypothetical protein